LALFALLRHAAGMPSHTHHAAPRELCSCCHAAYAPAKSSLCQRCESELYPGAGPGSRVHLTGDRRAGSDRRRDNVPVAVNLREIDRRGFLEVLEEEDLLGH
jgi:hypothetical protein